MHIRHILRIQHFEVDFLKIASTEKHICAVFCRLYLYARNLCGYFHDRPFVIIQPCDNTAISVRININNIFAFWFYFVGKNNLGSNIWYFIIKAASGDKRKRHLFCPQIQIPGQLNLRHPVIRNHHPVFTCLVTVPRNPGPDRFLITPLHNLPGRIVNHHILIGPVCKLQPVPVERDGISFRAFARFFSA